MPATDPFTQKKASILTSLSHSSETYEDLSPKGSIDEPIRDLINEINSYNDLVTTSSCSGRISVFLEGSGSGGKGGGEKGRWLFVSHESISAQAISGLGWTSVFGLESSVTKVDGIAAQQSRHVHFKFEPLILHILCATASAANQVLRCAQQAGFRESGASNVSADETVPINVAVRTMGLGFDSIVGQCMNNQMKDEEICCPIVSEDYLNFLVKTANDRFHTNSERRDRLRFLLQQAFGETKSSDWEATDARRERKRQEGLLKQQQLSNSSTQASTDSSRDVDAQDDLGLAVIENG